MSSAEDQHRNGLNVDPNAQGAVGAPDATAPNPVANQASHVSPNPAASHAAAQHSITQNAITAANRAVDAARRAATAAETVREVRARAKALRDRANIACRDADEAEAVLAAAENASATANQEVVDAALSAALVIDPGTSRGAGDNSVGSAADVSNDLDNYAAARSIAAHLGLAVPHSPGSGASGLPASSRAPGASGFSMGEPSNTNGLSNLSSGTPLRNNGSIHNPTANIAALRAIGAQLGVNLSSPSSSLNNSMLGGMAGLKRTASHLPPPENEHDTIARRKARHSLEITSNNCADCEAKVSRQWRRFDGDMCCHTCYQRRWRKRKAEDQDAGITNSTMNEDHGGDAASAATASAAAAAAHLQQQLNEPLSQLSAQSMGHPHYLDNTQPEPPHPFES
ncbi:unnamed protein product [Tilletia controversa]|uniref:Uncharacterized protein n=3 Tax=Tilletia TaxID=13289 RepID=A0A8X7MNN7_9BASI|nr:hypothetical protein CF336_g5214 [Tilletia laevis]KAE8194159.1 hypothetical protein CF328_g4835 [Tilletia controversa]KAE8258107.1 hypothetical protein A4X03_0g4482 [Tilletia caries]KAE8197869.1 hypothetical protein CF335_g4518 [Tilletia laevis]KAE8243163.1 hypothetical protein A4X06_0g6507 [Tilletia controversa]